jgi:hypothetical protein
MRQFLAGRGMVATGAAVVAAMRADAAAGATAPAHLASSAFNVAMLAAEGQVDAAMSVAPLAIAQRVGRMFALAKLKAAAAVIVVGAAVIPLTALGARALRSAVSAEAEPPTTAPAGAPFSARVTDEIRVEFLGVAPHPADESQWHSIAGEPIDMPHPRLADNEVNTDSQPDRQIALRIAHPADTQVVMQTEGTRTTSNTRSDEAGGSLLRSRFAMTDAGDETLSLRLAFTTRAWETVAECDAGDQPVEVDSEKFGPLTIAPPQEGGRWGPASVDVRHGPAHTLIAQMIAVDDAGKRHVQEKINVNSNNDDWVTSFVFDVPPEKIRNVVLQVREFDKYVVVKDISLSPDVKTKPQISVVDAGEKK